MNVKIRLLALVLIGVLGSASGAIPLPEHPRPDFERTEWLNLNGEWDFRFDTEATYTEKILVPFGWGSPASGVKDAGDVGWYRRSVAVPAAWKGKRVFVVIGAADHDTEAFFAGEKLGKHVGGYTPFEFELTEFVKWGESQTLEFRIWDPPAKEARNGHYLYGKQGYGNARGIWQTVYLEARGEEFVRRVALTPNAAQGSVTATVALGAPAKRTSVCTLEVGGVRAALNFSPGDLFASETVVLAKPHLWTLEDPYLYDVTCTYGDDCVRTYFGLRDIGTGQTPNGDWYVTLNGQPLYLQLCLDQSYHPEGWYTFPTDEFMKNEILIAKRLGLSGNRVHIKVEVPRKLYWADRLGVLIQADVPCAWGNASEAMFAEHWSCFEDMLARDYNHPCVYQWTLFNETWGLFSNRSLEMGLASGGKGKRRVYRAETQRRVAEAYVKAKLADPTRLVEDNSPCNRDHVVTDVYTWHSYNPGWKWEGVLAHRCRNAFAGSTEDFVGGHVQRGTEPMMNSECGNVWGYSGSTGDCDLTWDYHMMINAFRRHLKCAGWLYTEHHDVCNEWNGYVRFDRSAKEFGLGELFPGMSMRDFHADAYLPLDTELCRTFAPGETYTVPVDVSFTTDRYAGCDLTLTGVLHYLDAAGEERFGDTNAPALKIGKGVSWQYGHLADVGVRLPETEAAGTVNFTLFADGRPVARNFTCFRTRTPGDAGAKPVRAEWSEGTTNVLAGLKFSGFGRGFFEYEFAAADGGVFLAEVSAKRKNAKDFPKDEREGGLDYMLGGGVHNRGNNPNSYPQTSEEKWPGEVKVFANGTEVATVKLPDDPADHRGILSWAAQPRDGSLHEAGSYGYLVRAEIPKALVKDGKVTVRLEGDRGLAVYGPDFGRYPFGPHIQK